ncbi:cytochrome P450 [Marinobacter alexandrii]|uniref:cytochrome P450 n=1 Tax=Marinobacter alexandrii TaxID=2570351 RepID=UPI00329993FA
MKATNESDLPQGLQLTPLDDAFREDPYHILKRLRKEAPTHKDEVMGRFFVTRHDDVKNLLHDREFYTEPSKANPGTFSREILAPSLVGDEKPSMLLMDEPGHRRLRSLVSKPFQPKNVERWRAHVREIVESTLDKISTPEFDLIEQFAGPVPTVVIAEMLGIDAVYHDQFKSWSDLSVQIGFNPFPTEAQQEQGDAANQALDQFFIDEIGRRSQDLGDDLISDMLRADVDGEKLTQEEIVSQCQLLLIAGNVTTTDLIGNAVKALLDNPAQLEKLRSQPNLIANTVEEVLRYESPVLNSGRIPNRDIHVSGCPVGHGESLSVILAAANRDPEVYPDPDVFDIEREDTHHQSFGGGRHLCLGAHLARVEAQEAILGLLDRYPSLTLSEKGFVYHAIPSFRGFSELWVSAGSSTGE